MSEQQFTDAADYVSWEYLNKALNPARSITTAYDPTTVLMIGGGPASESELVASLRARLSRADATNEFLAESIEAIKRERDNANFNLKLAAQTLKDMEKGFMYKAATDGITMTRDCFDNAPAPVKDWLKAFGVYGSGPKSEPPVSEPDKPIDPRSETLGRAMSADRPLDGRAR